jgi:Diadenosine tetraphosphate (Ap4A) hydrolase and other HIT family hydrolases
MDCLFCKIINGDIASTMLYQDKDVIAINDIHPQAPLHQLVIPRKHIATLNDLGDDDTWLVGRLVEVAKQLAHTANLSEPGYRLVFNCNQDGGQAVFHLHLHLLGGRLMQWPPG